MAYDTANPPALVSRAPLGGSSPQTWVYRSTHTGAETDAANFITNALDLGMSVGDIVIVSGSTTYLQTSHTVMAVTTAGADLGDGTTVGSTTNSD